MQVRSMPCLNFMYIPCVGCDPIAVHLSVRRRFKQQQQKEPLVQIFSFVRDLFFRYADRIFSVPEFFFIEKTLVPIGQIEAEVYLKKFALSIIIFDPIQYINIQQMIFINICYIPFPPPRIKNLSESSLRTHKQQQRQLRTRVRMFWVGGLDKSLDRERESRSRSRTSQLQNRGYIFNIYI